MTYIKLRVQSIPNLTGIGAPFSKTTNWFDTVGRKPYTTQEDSATDVAFQLTKGDIVFSYEYRPGKTRQVRYDGNGSVYTTNVTGPATPGGPVTSLIKVAGSSGGATSAQGVPDAYLDLTAQLGAPPYQVLLQGISGPANGYSQTKVSPSESYPQRFYNLAAGTYRVTVTDAQLAVATQQMVILPGVGVPVGFDLHVTYSGDQTSGSGTRKLWVYNDLATYEYQTPAGSGNDGDDYYTPGGFQLDAYLLPDGVTWRRVFSDGQGEVYFKDSSTALTTSTLELDNLILFNPDTAAEQNGGCLVEVIASVPPVSFTLNGVTNQTGSFDGLTAGSYEVLVRDAIGNSLKVPFVLRLSYGLWKRLRYDNQDSTPLRVELWKRDFDGAVSDICGTDHPVILKSDGLSSTLGGQGDLPASVGTSAELNFLTEPDLFEPIELGDDRLCRADIYYNNQLQFRGYVQPDIYHAPLLDGLQPSSLTATDGLAALKDTDMLGHVGQRLGIHRPVLNTLVHCLSRCGVSLPVRIYTNRRDSAMATVDAPETAATTNRAGYWDEEKNEPVTQRTVVDALAQLLGGTLVQRAGAWEIRSALEAATPADGRLYRPAGTANGLDAILPAAGTIYPPGKLRWHWLTANQAKQVRPGWKSLAGKTDAGWLKNAYWQGEVFNDVYAWVEDGSTLRTIDGWRAGNAPRFPLVLVRTGEKGQDHSTSWLRGAIGADDTTAYLQGPPLPLAVGPEAVPAILSFTGKFVASEYYVDYDGATLPSPTTSAKGYLPYQILYSGKTVEGIKVAEFTRATTSTAKDETISIKLPVPPSDVLGVTLRIYPWYAPDTGLLSGGGAAPIFVFGKAYAKGDVVRDDFGNHDRLFVARRSYTAGLSIKLVNNVEWAEITATNEGTGQFLLTSVGVELRPQGATWDGADNFRADGPAGTVRPTEALDVYHPDSPLAAGLFSANLFAFSKAVGLADGTQTTSWSRSIDEGASPLFEANVYDELALRANPSRLLTGIIRHAGIAPPYLLDSVDPPFDLPGRRFLVAAASWDMKPAEVDVSLVEIGVGAGADYQWPNGGRILHRSYLHPSGVYLPFLRSVKGGRIRVRHG